MTFVNGLKLKRHTNTYLFDETWKKEKKEKKIVFLSTVKPNTNPSNYKLWI